MAPSEAVGLPASSRGCQDPQPAAASPGLLALVITWPPPRVSLHLLLAHKHSSPTEFCFLAALCGMQDLSSPTRAQTRAPP